MSEPVVLVISECAETNPCKIINEIRNVPQEEKVCDVNGETGYKHSIKSKYYEIDVILYPFVGTNSLTDVSESFLETVEGVVIYFDPAKREFLEKLETYASFLEDRGIELGILLCQRVFDSEKDGITYKEAKQHSRLLDLIELSPDKPSEDEPQGGYDELHTALRNTIWSNISMNGSKKETKKSSEMNEKEIEDKLADFEKLLTQAVNFRANTTEMGRNERLLYAQQFADAFESIFGVESDEEDDDTTQSGASYKQLE
ncbi:alpha- and gamma-adaptin-binding protein p34 [Culicoides brevitarsis]|uniref:alpha- and gamma-adaptin-binding protein p34 n=1 Tax=Culicoides brevitarsis TaxID=469753 RepID=UPI00307C9707